MVPSRVERALNGIQAGMVGGFAMTAVMVILSVFDGRVWWSYLNLLSVHFYGPRALAAGPGWPSLSGMALQLTLAGVAGAIFALLFSGLTSGVRLALFGLFWGLALFFVSERIHDRVTPLVAVHLQRGSVMLAHMVYGLLLASIPHGERPDDRAEAVEMPFG
jgi:hypothetical protein